MDNLKKYTMTIVTTLYCGGSDDEIKDFAQKRANLLKVSDERVSVVYLSEYDNDTKPLINEL